MKLREATAADIPALHALYTGEMPPFDGTLFAVYVIEDDGGVIRMAVTAQRTAEAFLLVDPSWATPGERLAALEALHGTMLAHLHAQGVANIHAWLPPEIARSFGRRLMRRFGWTKPLWECFARKV